MKWVLILIFFITTGCSSQSSKNNIEKDSAPLINSFFQTIKNQEAASALDILLKSNPNIDIEDSATLHLKSSFVIINQASGVFMGYRLLKKRFIEDDIGIYSYLAKYEKKFYRFVFMFYNNGDHIKLYKFLFDDNLDVELEESLKYYLN